MLKLKDILKDLRLVETGIRDINRLAKENKEADLYFHQDLDGVTSAIGIKAYLEKYGVKVVRAIHIEYGGREYSAPKPKPGRMVVLVDFSHGKPGVTIHTDHHQTQHGVEKGTASSFKKKPSNIETISQEISPSDIFPTDDIKLISTVDSADFARQGISVDDVMKTSFKLDKSNGVLKNIYAMGFVTNLVLLAFKNKPEFLEQIVMKAKPSLISIYTVAMDIARRNGYSPDDLDIPQAFYMRSQRPEKKLKKFSSPNDIQNLEDGEYGMVGNVVVQYGTGNLRGGGYDRYAVFKLNPEAEYRIVGYSSGMVQAAKNPFKSGTNPYNLGDIAMKIVDRYKSYLKKKTLTFSELKRRMESEIERSGSDESFGFTMRDLSALFGGIAKGIPKDEKKDLIAAIAEKQYRYLTPEERKQLDLITITGYDLVKSQSGGHRDITNISGLGLLGDDNADFVKKLMRDLAVELKDIKLQ